MESFIYYILDKFFENDNTNLLFNKLKQKNSAVIFDIGCYKGNFTINLINHFKKNKLNSYKNYSYFLFDPIPNLKKELINQNNLNYKYLEYAVDSKSSKKEFYLNQFYNSAGSSLIGIHYADRLWLNSRKIFMKIMNPFKIKNNFKKINVKTISIDDFVKKNNIDKIDLLKIDSEGNEYNILLGSKITLKNKKIDMIYLEVLDNKNKYCEKENLIINFLKNYNFSLLKKDKLRLTSFLSDIIAYDLFFIKKN